MEIELPKWMVYQNNLGSKLIEVIEVERETAKAILVIGTAKIRPSSHCWKCGLPLTDPVSIELGIGPICAGIDQRDSMSQKDKDEYVKRFSTEHPIKTWIPKRYLKDESWRDLLPKTENQLEKSVPISGTIVEEQKEKPVPIFDVQIIVHSDRICVKSKYEYASTCKSIMGGRWNPEHKMWVYPLTSAKEVVEAFSWVENKKISDEVLALVETGKKIQEIKIQEDLPEIPISYGPPQWLHQKQAFWFSKELPASGLFMDMGTGKSRVAVDLIQNCKEDEKILILCPKKVVNVWPREFKKYSDGHFNFAPLTGSTEQKRAQAEVAWITNPDGLVVIVNYDSAWRNVEYETYIYQGRKHKREKYFGLAGWILEQKWDRIILDESHRAKQWDGRIGKFIGELNKVSKRRQCLTGTPMPHSPMDIWSQYNFLDPNIFGNYYKFRNRYARMGGYMNKQIVGYQNLDELNEKIYSIAFRVLAKDVLDLPEEMHETMIVEMSPEAWKWYQKAQDDMRLYISETEKINTEIVLTKILRMQQITSGYLPGKDTCLKVDNGKTEMLEDILEDIDAHEPVVVFCKFQHDLDEVKQLAEKLGRTYGEISGRSTSGLNNQAELKEGVAICAVQIQAGGVGIDLTRSHYGIYYSVGYSLGDYEQSIKRLHRPGQKNHVMFYHLVVGGSIDEIVYSSLEGKKNLIEEVLRSVR